jgi:anti-sigma regulatory factor (Ser/Thr protein kinase)
MKELSLHILDIAQNSIAAGADKVTIHIIEDTVADTLVIGIYDNGRGMDEEERAKVLNPFYTTRTTRKVGLGLPLFQAAARQCNGELFIESVSGRGTRVKAVFQHSHIDRAPIGDIIGTLLTLIVCNPNIHFKYIQEYNGDSFELDTAAIRGQLGGVPIGHPLVIDFLKDFFIENIKKITGGACHEIIKGT